MPARANPVVMIAALSLSGALAVNAQSLDRSWSSEGYGLYFDLSGQTLKAFEMTAISCLPSFTAQRAAVETNGDVVFKVVDRPTTFVLRSGGSPNRRQLHMNGAASDIVLRRGSAPAVCSTPTRDTPLTNFDVFTRTWAEQYGINQTFSGSRRSANWLERADRPRAFEIVEQKYLRTPLRSWCNGQVQDGRLDGGVAYVRIKSFSSYGPQPGFESGLTALEDALDSIFADASSWPGLVIDVRINGGGSDPYGLAIASRLTSTEYVDYAKQARSDPQNRRNVHAGAAQTNAAHHAHRRKHTGLFSDVLGRVLPNGWRFGLPNERFVTDGKSYDGPGIPPDVIVPVFPKSDLDAGRDGALDKALTLLVQRRGGSAKHKAYLRRPDGRQSSVPASSRS